MLISIGFTLQGFSKLPEHKEMNCFCKYEIQLCKIEYGKEDEHVILTINSFQNLHKELSELKKNKVL